MMPLEIRHTGRRAKKADTEELVRECARCVHLTSGGEKLLQFYATCSSGFRPAKKLIAEKTGINVTAIYRYREELDELALVDVDEKERRLSVNWERIRLYSTLDPEMTSRHRKTRTVNRVKKVTMREAGARFKPRAEGRQLTPAQRHFYDALDRMTEDEWNAINRAMGAKIPEPIQIEDPPRSLWGFEDMAWDAWDGKDPEPFNYYGDIDLPF